MWFLRMSAYAVAVGILYPIGIVSNLVAGWSIGCLRALPDEWAYGEPRGYFKGGIAHEDK